MAHREICALERCPEKTHARLRDKGSGKRQDLCIVHAVLTKREFKDKVELVEEWGTNKVFDEDGEIIFGRIHFETKEEATQKELVKRAVEGATK